MFGGIYNGGGCGGCGGGGGGGGGGVREGRHVASSGCDVLRRSDSITTSVRIERVKLYVWGVAEVVEMVAAVAAVVVVVKVVVVVWWWWWWYDK